MSKANKPTSLLELFPEETREAADLLSRLCRTWCVTTSPNPVHYALWYSYCQGNEPELQRRLDKIVKDFDAFPRKAPSSCTASSSSEANWTKHAKASNR